MIFKQSVQPNSLVCVGRFVGYIIPMDRGYIYRNYPGSHKYFLIPLDFETSRTLYAFKSMYFKHKAFVVDMEPLMSYAEAVKMCGDIYFSGAQMYIETHRESDGIYEFSRDSNQAWRNARERWRQEAFELGIKQSRTI